MIESNTGNTVVDTSVNIISNFAQRVHDNISYLNVKIEENSDEHTDIYTKLSYIDSVHQNIYEQISQLENKSEYEISCIADSDNSNMLVIQKNKS